MFFFVSVSHGLLATVVSFAIQMKGKFRTVLLSMRPRAETKSNCRKIAIVYLCFIGGLNSACTILSRIVSDERLQTHSLCFVLKKETNGGKHTAPFGLTHLSIWFKLRCTLTAYSIFECKRD